MHQTLSAPLGLSALTAAEPQLVLPSYDGHGLFNLAASLGRVCVAEVAGAAHDLILSDGRLAAEAWASHRQVVFFLIDGLGDATLSRHRDLAPNLWRHRKQTLTSVFPSTTATAITTLLTGACGAAHGLLGWFVREREGGRVVAPLPMRYRAAGNVGESSVRDGLLRTPPLFATAQRQTHVVTRTDLVRGAYSDHHRGQATPHPYAELQALAPAVVKAVAGSGQHFVYAYTPLLDTAAHDYGVSAPRTLQTLAEIDAAYAQLCAALPEALIVSCADHGLIDAPAARYIDLTKHAGLYDMLSGPMSGERRAAICHVKARYADVFGDEVSRQLGDAVHALRLQDALRAGLFGPGGEAAAEEMGALDWLLIPRDDRTVFDTMPGETMQPMVGVHGGLSAEEMLVPLMIREPGSLS